MGLLAGISWASLDFLLGYIEVFSFGLVGAISSLIWAASGPFIWAFLGLFLGLAGRFLGFFGPAGGGFFGLFFWALISGPFCWEFWASLGLFLGLWAGFCRIFWESFSGLFVGCLVFGQVLLDSFGL